jgi:hypothetical protein
MPAWYWALLWITPVIGIAILWYQPRFRISITGLYVGTTTVMLLPLIWRKAKDSPRARLWVTLFLLAGAGAVFWTTIFGWPF